MALEQLNDNYWQLSPGPFDVHTHPRVFDALTTDNFDPVNEGTEGKAGLRAYTEVALRSGIVGMIAMPNEARRVYDQSAPHLTTLEQTPIANLVLVQKMQDFILQQAYIPTAIHFGIDRRTALRHKGGGLKSDELSRHFAEVRKECASLKVYLAETTGDNDISVNYGAAVARLWHEQNPEKPIVFHVEGDNVAFLLRDIIKLKDGKDIPVHIAHVSSRQELMAVIDAKRARMNVTCEVTPHHLFLDESVSEEIGGYGCMKPGLKTQEDIDFLWANMKSIDIFASDCAPHRRRDKERENPAFGVTNHTLMLPLLLGAIADGRLTMEDIYQKLCVKPRERFNLPLEDNSYVGLGTALDYSVQESSMTASYGFDPFNRLQRRFHLVGEVVVAQAGKSEYHKNRELKLTPSYTHLIRPKNLNLNSIRRNNNE